LGVRASGEEQAATLLIDQHGSDAPMRAARRADELLGEGDTEGSGVWPRTLEPREKLERGRREGERLN
jgi:hypothetical protein